MLLEEQHLYAINGCNVSILEMTTEEWIAYRSGSTNYWNKFWIDYPNWKLCVNL